MKILSFVIPAYNSERFLDICIPSMLVPEVLNKLEIIVVNDGSTDTTETIAKKYYNQYPDVVKVISQENKGHGGALNTGRAVAQGNYIKVIDADDWLETQNLPTFIQLLEHCNSDVVLTHHHTIDISTGEIKNWKTYVGEFGRCYTFDEIMANWRNFDRSLNLHGITYRTAFYQEFGIPLSEHVFYEDYEYATFPCCHAKSVTPFDLFLYDYRIGDVNQSVSEYNQLKRISHIESVLNRMIDEYMKLSNIEDARKSYITIKIQELLLSYLTTALLVNPNKQAGRQLAKQQMAHCQTTAPAVYNLIKRKYQIFSVMNRLHISKQIWNSILNSRIYRIIQKRHSFQ